MKVNRFRHRDHVDYDSKVDIRCLFCSSEPYHHCFWMEVTTPFEIWPDHIESAFPATRISVIAPLDRGLSVYASSSFVLNL